MLRIHRFAVVAVLLAVPVGRPPGAQIVRSETAGPPERTFEVVVVQEILDELARLADTARTETARCLVGVIQGENAIVDLLVRPRIEFSDHRSVRYQGCPLATIAEWHNHPWTRVQAPEELCYLSRTDIVDGLGPRSAPIQIVQVTAEVSCWWGRRQIETARGRSVLRPLAGQHTGSGRPTAEARGGAAQLARFGPPPWD